MRQNLCPPARSASKGMFFPCLRCGLFLLAVAAPAPAQAPAEAEPIKLTLSPAAVPSPALKYVLLPEVKDQSPGNAALEYYRAFSPEWWGHIRQPKTWETISNALQTPLNDLPRKNLAWLEGSTMLRQVERASRREYVDWGMAERLRREGYQSAVARCPEPASDRHAPGRARAIGDRRGPLRQGRVHAANRPGAGPSRRRGGHADPGSGGDGHRQVDDRPTRRDDPATRRAEPLLGTDGITASLLRSAQGAPGRKDGAVHRSPGVARTGYDTADSAAATEVAPCSWGRSGRAAVQAEAELEQPPDGYGPRPPCLSRSQKGSDRGRAQTRRSRSAAHATSGLAPFFSAVPPAPG